MIASDMCIHTHWACVYTHHTAVLQTQKETHRRDTYTYTRKELGCRYYCVFGHVYAHVTPAVLHIRKERPTEKTYTNKKRARVYVLLRVWACIYTRRTGCITHTERDPQKRHIHKKRALAYVLLRGWACIYTHPTGCIPDTKREPKKRHIHKKRALA